MSLEALVAFGAVGAGLCLVFGLPRLLTADSSWIDSRLRRYASGGIELTDEEQKRAASVQVTQMLAQRIEASISGRTFAAALRTDLARANLRVTVGEFLILQASATVLCAALAYLLSGAYLVTGLVGAVGWFAPRIWLARRTAARLKAFNNQLADTIALISNSLRSGMSLAQSMEMISREAEPPVSEEFQRVVREIGLGVGPQQALQHLVRRIASDDLELMVTAILVQFEIGGNLSRILDSIAGTIRERVKLHGEIRTLSAQGRMSGLILTGLPVVIGGLLMLIAPSYMGKLFTPGPWLALPVLAAFGIAMGMLVVNKLVAIEV